MAQNGKPKFGMYWAASCGGCEIAVLNIGEKILDVDAAFEIAFWPVAADFKYADVHSYVDGTIDICLFNGAIRTSENEELARLLRQKSKILVAFGSCSYQGSVPALANLTNPESIMRVAFQDNPSIDNPQGVLPQTLTQVPEGELHLPVFYRTVKSLDQVVPVDYFIPGCPPEPHQIWTVLEAVVAALKGEAELPPRGSIIGAGNVAVCDECMLEKHEKQITHFYRPYEIQPEAGICLLEQGLICSGPATRSGCGALCPQVGIGCRGCYGALDEVDDQGARLISAIASVGVAGKLGVDDEEELAHKAALLLGGIADPAGTFYRFSLAHSLLNRRRFPADGNGKGEKP